MLTAGTIDLLERQMFDVLALDQRDSHTNQVRHILRCIRRNVRHHNPIAAAAAAVVLIGNLLPPMETGMDSVSVAQLHGAAALCSTHLQPQAERALGGPEIRDGRVHL